MRISDWSSDVCSSDLHSMFVEPADAQSAEYRAFWDKLRRGEYDAGQYRRIGKGGREVWIQASYNPVLDRSGRPVKVVKFATDITAQKQETADFQGQLAAIEQAQAVINFGQHGRASCRGRVGQDVERPGGADAL